MYALVPSKCCPLYFAGFTLPDAVAVSPLSVHELAKSLNIPVQINEPAVSVHAGAVPDMPSGQKF